MGPHDAKEVADHGQRKGAKHQAPISRLGRLKGVRLGPKGLRGLELGVQGLGFKV